MLLLTLCMCLHTPHLSMQATTSEASALPWRKEAFNLPRPLARHAGMQPIGAVLGKSAMIADLALSAGLSTTAPAAQALEQLCAQGEWQA